MTVRVYVTHIRRAVRGRTIGRTALVRGVTHGGTGGTVASEPGAEGKVNEGGVAPSKI